MIRSFGDKDTRALYEGKVVPRWRSLSKQAQRGLQILSVATCIEDLKNLPSNRFKALTGRRVGQYSIRINQQWRVCFVWLDEEPHEVKIVDYH